MKKLVGIAFVGMMALGACGGGSAKPADTAATPPPAQTDPNAAPAQTDPNAAPAPAPAPAQN
jgi:hypothetical protein